MPRILLLDIETAPNLAYIWRIFKENIGTNQIVQSGYVLSWAAKWLGQREIKFDAVWKSGERKMLRNIHALLDEADIVIHYNGKSFDIPTLNREFVKHGLQPPSPYKQIDLLLFIRETFAFVSKKLDYVSDALGLGKKVQHPGFMLWVNAMNGDRKAHRLMEKYNKHDVRLLERLYLRVRPWIPRHPNLGAWSEKSVCPKCGKHHIQRRGVQVAKTLKYARYHCQDCGAWFRGAQPISNWRGKTRYVEV